MENIDQNTNLADLNKTLPSLSSKNLFWIGVGLCVLGVLAVFFPMISSLSVGIFAGSLLFVSGCFSLAHTFKVKEKKSFWLGLVASVFKIIGGLVVLAFPYIGVLYLTSLVAMLFILEGLFESIYSFKLKPNKGWGALLLSGFISLICGIITFSTLAVSSLFILGFIFGASLLSSGIALCTLSYPQKKAKV